MKIGLFDSGVGGRSFIAPLMERFPGAEVIYKEDIKNIPYGNKSAEQLLMLTIPYFKEFEAEKCDVVLIACNTVTTNIIHELRSIVTIPLVGVEPMIKPAALLSRTGVIAVCATPGTLKSDRYAFLKKQHAHSTRVIEPDCSNWATLIENNQENEIQLQSMVDQLRQENVDVIVLGCTHYHWIEEKLQHIAGPGMMVIQPIEPVLDQLERVLASDKVE